MKSGIVLVALLMLIGLCGACIVAPEPDGNQPPLITSLEAKYMTLYPRGGTEIKCTATDPEGDRLNYKWSCTGGTFDGAGPIITWEAPRSYGEYHIMVIVEDDEGKSAKDTLTFNVIGRPQESCCGN